MIRDPKTHHSYPYVEVDSRVYRLLTQDEGFLRLFHRPYQINNQYDVPYLCGYSRDGRTRYVDRHFWTHRVMPGGFDTLPSLMIHEGSEKALEDRFHLVYEQAHHIATHLEFLCVHRRGMSWLEYCRYLTPYIKEVGHESIKHPPPDLDLTPYTDEKDKRDLAALMRRGHRSAVVEEITRRQLLELDLTLQRHSRLNQELWDGDTLRPEVREKLLAFSRAWGHFAKIPPELVQDVHMVGGSAGYNWTPFSDIDVHLIVDRSKLGSDRALVDEFLATKKSYWTVAHQIKVKGLPVEPYAQDVEEASPPGQGVYSLTRGEWVQRPSWDVPNRSRDPGFRAKVQSYLDTIDDLISRDAPDEEVSALKDKLKNMRKAGISKGGEFSPENFMFKELRNNGALDRLSSFVRTRDDASLSL